MVPKTQDIVMPNEESFVIETDEQELKNSEDIGGESNEIFSTHYELDIREDKKSVYDYMRQHEQGRLIIDPDYQRHLVWKNDQKSRFIESVLLNFPLPPIYLNQRRDGKYVIVDGLQRTTTLRDFMNNQFALSNLTALKALNNKKASELPDGLLARLEEKSIFLYIIKPSVPIGVVYELFDRINTGGTALNRQEVRNCILMGKSTQLLKELSQQNYFTQAIDKGVSGTRMKDREVILRYLSFKIFDYQKDYKGDLSPFLENAMQRINSMGEEEIEILRQDFKRVMKLSYEIFGNRSFRYPINNPDGSFKSRGFFNTSIFESVCYFFSNHSDDFLRTNRNRIVEQYDVLLKNADYYKAVRFSTGNKQSVWDRFRLVETILGNV